MAPSTKENEVLTAPPEKNSTVSVPAAAPRFDETATASRPQPVALEIPVTVNGARTVDGSDKREPFSETTKTVLVFGNGAVIRLGSPVAAGQLLFLTNEKTKKEVVCQVVKSKNYKSVSGYVELEFTESVVGFWGMRFPSDRIGAPALVAAPIASVPPAAKPNPVAPISVVTAPVVSGVISAPRIPEVKPAQPQTPQIHAEAKPVAPQPRPAGVATPPAPKTQTPSVQNISAPVAKKADTPVIPAPSASSLASSLASLLGAPEVPPAVAPSKPRAQAVPFENKPQPTSVATDNSSEELKQQAARLQEQLSSMLFSAAPNAKPASPAPVVPALDAKAVSGVAAQVLEIAKPEPSPVRIAPPAKPLPPPIKSSLDTEEVKIPSWLEPLARNAAASPPVQDPVDREKGKQASDAAGHETRSEENLSLTALEDVPESALPGIGSLLPVEEETNVEERPSGGSGKGALYGAIAAAVLLAAGGAWYFLRPTNAAPGTPAPATSLMNFQPSATPAPSAAQPAAQPASQPAAQNSTTAAIPVSGSKTAQVVNMPAVSAPVLKSPAGSQAAPVTRDNSHGTGTTIPAAVTERISRPPAEPEPKKPALGEVHLAGPTVNRAAAAQNDGEAPSISSGNSDAIAGGLGSGLPAGNAKQPAAPEVPLPIGGDVKSAQLISKVAAVYPALAKAQHVSGDVRIDALIDANGRVTTMKVISGPTLLHQAAMDSLRQWKYQPAILDGKAVPMHLTVTLQFRLQ
jgi:TonB family protein